ncbi:MAG TPA: DEAD/DEAH box helicase, partial [Methanosarcinales archaeon]|nr:DEAD/DEAH box helicase [Methanosarcinales archaeon]
MTLTILVQIHKNKIIIFPIKDNKQKPIFEGILTIGITNKGPRPSKFKIKKSGTDGYLQPKEAINLFRRSNRIMIAQGGDKEMEKQFKEFLKAYQLKSESVYVCRYCLLD